MATNKLNHLNRIFRTHNAPAFHRLLALQHRRYLLTQSHYCDTEWKARLSSPVFDKVNADFMISELFLQFEKNKAASAVDLEVFANKIQDVHPSQLNVVESLLKKFRRCSQATSVIDSMSHAVIRGYIELGAVRSIIPILQQKIDFGIFPDHHANCLLMDTFIKSNDLENAVNIAVEMMLQEDMTHNTARNLALLSCMKNLIQSQDSLLAAFVEDDKPTLDEEEEEYIVVKFLPKYNFDGHFDVTNKKVLIGKVLAFIGTHEPEISLHKNIRLIGLAMSENLACLINELETQLSDTSSPSLYKETVELISKSVDACRFKTETIVREPGTELKEDSEYNARLTVEEKQMYKDKFEAIKSGLFASQLGDRNLLEDVEHFVKTQIEAQREKDITSYKCQIEAWNQQRQENVLLQERAFKLKTKQETLDKKIKELTEKEELLNYFVRHNDISLSLLRSAKPQEEVGEVDLEEYVAEPGKRSKKG